jgi:cytochrome c-type biogenesis protein
MILALLLTFFAGSITVLAPCVLPLLPVIIGGSFTGVTDKKRPFIIAASLSVSIVVFTLLLKVSTSLIGVSPTAWTSLSGGIVIALGVATLFPSLWDKAIGALGLQAKAQATLGSATRKGSAVLTGFALGPVFSSCSPTYVWIIATVLPENTSTGFIHLISYTLGLTIMLLLIGLLGRRWTDKINWLSNPHGFAQKAIGILFILVGLSIISGFDKKLQTYLVERDFLNLQGIEQKLVPEEKQPASQ